MIVLGEALQAPVSTFSAFGAALFVTAFASCVAQVIVPLASTLAAEHERGAVVTAVMSGLLIGILLARTISGLIAGVAGWV